MTTLNPDAPRRRMAEAKSFIVSLLFFLSLSLPLSAQEIVLKGRVIDPDGNALPNATVQLLDHGQVRGQATTGPDGRFQIALFGSRQEGQLVIKVDASGFRPVEQPVRVFRASASEITVRLTQLSSRVENVTVIADMSQSDVLSPDPAEKIFVRQDLLDANPRRPGAPVSIPGYPIETASSGIKAARSLCLRLDTISLLRECYTF